MSPSPVLLHGAFKFFRSRRMRLFERTFKISAETRILDLGGSPAIWEFATVQPKLTIANIPSALERGTQSIALVGADGCHLPFRDQSFDIVFSNSVIEHVGSIEAQRMFAAEIARVGRSYWVQTPNRRFPLEMHTMLPFVHFLPKGLQRKIVERFTVWERVVRPDRAQRDIYVAHVLNEMKLLTAADLQGLFPQSRILRERTLGITKSIVAVHRRS